MPSCGQKWTSSPNIFLFVLDLEEFCRIHSWKFCRSHSDKKRRDWSSGQSETMCSAQQYFRRINCELFNHVIRSTNEIPLYQRSARWVELRPTLRSTDVERRIVQKWCGNKRSIGFKLKYMSYISQIYKHRNRTVSETHLHGWVYI